MSAAPIKLNGPSSPCGAACSFSVGSDVSTRSAAQESYAPSCDGNNTLNFEGGAPEAVRLVKRFLRDAERVAEFTTYERLFSLWHILHIPLIYLLAASTIFHIIAVYMY